MPEHRVTVKVSAGAKTELVEELVPGVYKVRVKAPPERGKANARVISLLAKHFKVSAASIILISGSTSRDKIFIIDR